MSWTEINQEKGMPFGGMPHGALLYKLEETDPELVRGGNDPTFDMEDHYDEYVRAEIVDWAPDTTYLESDHPRRDPTLSQSMLNLRYSGGRGPNDYRYPHHPELFLGFTGNDPRGVDTQPRFEQNRTHMSSRAWETTVRMGYNVGHGDLMEADRPWGGDAFEDGKRAMHQRLKNNHYYWFPAQKEGRPWGRNTVADEFYGLRQRRATIGNGHETLFTPEGGVGDQRTSYDPIRGAESDGVRRIDQRADAESAPWRHTLGDADLTVQRYTSATRGGRETFGPSAAGGGKLVGAHADQRFAVAADGRGGTNRRVLAEGMGAAAAHRRALSRAAEGDTTAGASIVARPPGRSAPELANVIASAVRQTRHDQTLRPAGQVVDLEGGAFSTGPGVPTVGNFATRQTRHDQTLQPAGQVVDGGRALGAGLTPSTDSRAALYATEQSHETSSNVRLASVEAMIRGLRQGTSAQLRMVQGLTTASGQLGGATDDVGAEARGGLVPPEHASVARVIELSLRNAAAAGLEVHNYGRAAGLGPRANTVALAAGGGFASAREARLGLPAGRSKPPEFRSHTQDPGVLSTHPDDAFGYVGEYAGPHTGGLSVGTKSLRASTLTDGGDDVIGAYSEYDGLSAGIAETGFRDFD